MQIILFILSACIFFIYSEKCISYATTKQKYLKRGIFISLGIFIYIYYLYHKENMDFTSIFCLYSFFPFLLDFLFLKKERQNFLKKDRFKKYLYIIFFFLAIASIIEIFICNFHYFKTMSYKKTTFPISSLKSNMNLEKEEIETVKNSYLEIKNINQKVKNIQVDITYAYSYLIKIKATDEANALYFNLPEREVMNRINSSKYLTLHLSGKSEKLKLYFSFVPNMKIKINQISINNPISLDFKITRFLLIASLFLFIYLFKPKSVLYKIKLLEYSHKRLWIIGLLFINFAFFAIMGNKAILSLRDPEIGPYQRLTDSLIKGKTYIEDQNHSEKWLSEMKNPYDTALRAKKVKEGKSMFFWDSAFYKGHYYVYFGVIPVILFYVPFKLIFHSYLSTAFFVFASSILCILLLVLLLYQFVKKYFNNCSLGVFTLLSLLLIYTTGLLPLIKLPNLYTQPIASAYMFTLLGLNLWIGTLKSQKCTKTKMFLGSLSMALVAGCRPQFLVGSFLFFPIFYAFYKERKKELSFKKRIGYIISLILPYIIVAAFLCFYNYIRFNSPFDFGANYNLTTNDMTKRGFIFSRIPLGIFVYLFNFMNFKNIFPYIDETLITTNYLGTTIYEPFYGGLIFTTGIFAISFFIPKFKKYIPSKILYSSLWLMLIFAFLIIIMDTEMAGILPRYIGDFAWLFGFITVILILSIENKNIKYKEIFHKVLFILISIALIYQFFYMFTSILNKFKESNTTLWLYFYYLIQFWL